MRGNLDEVAGQPANVMPAMTPQQAKFTSASGLRAYRELAVGSDGSFGFFIAFELATLFLSNLPGALGLGTRACVYPFFLGATGKRPAMGRGVVIRNPRKISLGNKVLVDDYAVLDVRSGNVHGEAIQAGITIGDCVSIGRFSTIAAKGGSIVIGNGANIGSYCRVATQSKIEIGESVLVGAYSYIGPGNHQAADDESPLISRSMENRGGVKIGNHAWIGAGVTILDGVTIGERAIVGAHSLVISDVPAGATVAGTPAKPLRS